MTDVTKHIGFRRTEAFGNDPKGIGWRAWIGPLLMSRSRRLFGADKGQGWAEVTAAGVTIGWYR